MGVGVVNSGGAKGWISTKKDKRIEAAYQIGADREALPLFNVEFYWRVACVCVSVCRVVLVVSDSFRPTRLLCPWGSPGKNIGEDCHSLLQGSLPHPGMKPTSLTSLALAGGFFTTSATWKAP